MDEFLKWVNGVSAYKSAYDVAVGDCIHLPNDSTGTVISIDGNKITMKVGDGTRCYDVQDVHNFLSSGCESDQVPMNLISSIYHSGDHVTVRDFYSAGNGSATGEFVSYNNDRETATVSINGEYRSVNIDLLSPDKCTPSNKKDSGNLSPISLSTTKDKKDMKSMEQIIKAVSDSMSEEVQENEKSCDCGSYDCEKCYPITEDELSYYADADDDNDYMSGRVGDEESQENADDLTPDEYEADMGGEEVEAPEDVSELISQILYMQEIGMSNSDKYYSEDTLMKLSPRSIQSIYGKVTGTVEEMGSGSVAVAHESDDISSGGSSASEDVSDIIAEIMFIQDAGMSASNKHFSKDTLMKLSPSAVKNIYDRVYGNVEEAYESEDLSEIESDKDVDADADENHENLDEMIYDDEDTLAPDHVKRKKAALADPLGLGYSKGDHDHLTYSGDRDDVIDMEYIGDPEVSKKYYDEYSPTDIMTQGKREYNHDADSYYDQEDDEDLIPEDTDGGESGDMPEPTYKDADEDTSEAISRIVDIQDSGMSACDKHYSEEALHKLPYASVMRILKKVEGNVSEAIPLAAIGAAARTAGAVMNAYGAYKDLKSSDEE